MQTDIMTKNLEVPSVPPNPDVLGVSPKLKPKILPLVFWPDEILHQHCKFVHEIDETLHQLIYDMAYTMYHKKGVGLAAPQVGVSQSVIVVEIDRGIIPLINPVILESNDLMYSFDEGCLSVPGYFEKRKRPQKVLVEYQTAGNVIAQDEFQGLAAFIVQHEIDHLCGKVFVDGISRLKQDRVKKKIKKFKGR